MTKKNYLETLKSALGRSIYHYWHNLKGTSQAKNIENRPERKSGLCAFPVPKKATWLDLPEGSSLNAARVCLNLLKVNLCLNLSINHLFPMHPFCTPWKH